MKRIVFVSAMLIALMGYHGCYAQKQKKSERLNVFKRGKSINKSALTVSLTILNESDSNLSFSLGQVRGQLIGYRIQANEKWVSPKYPVGSKLYF